MTGGPTSRDGADSAAREARGGLAHELGGDLPCARCRYNLKGLSVRGVCPECGLMIRATVLARVDPRASELAPVRHPRLVAWGLLAWTWGACVAAVCAWALRLAAYFAPDSPIQYHLDPLLYLVFLGVVVSGIGATALISPQERLSVRHRLCAIGGVACYIPVFWALWALHTGESGAMDLAGRGAYVERVMLGLGLIGIAMGLRPNGRALTARSFLMRQGMVDRQTLAGLAGAVALAMLGDAMNALIFESEAWRFIGRLLVLCGSVLVSLGLVGMLVDAWRIRGVVLQPPLSLGQLLAGPREDEA